MFDVIVVGGGPAGLQACLVFGRTYRNTLLIDDANPRNQYAHEVHTLLTQDSEPPMHIRKVAREQLYKYTTVQVIQDFVENIEGTKGAFTVTCRSGAKKQAKRILLALGVSHDQLPSFPGVREHWAKGVYGCPFCDGFERGRDSHFGVLIETENDVKGYADTFPFMVKKIWTNHVTLFTNKVPLGADVLERLKAAGVAVVDESVERVTGPAHTVDGVVLKNGETVKVDSLWVHAVSGPLPLVRQLGLKTFEEHGQTAVHRSPVGETSIPGIYCAGDASAGKFMQAALAVGDAAKTASMMVGLDLARE